MKSPRTRAGLNGTSTPVLLALLITATAQVGYWGLGLANSAPGLIQALNATRSFDDLGLNGLLATSLFGVVSLHVILWTLMLQASGGVLVKRLQGA